MIATRRLRTIRASRFRGIGRYVGRSIVNVGRPSTVSTVSSSDQSTVDSQQWRAAPRSNSRLPFRKCGDAATSFTIHSYAMKSRLGTDLHLPCVFLKRLRPGVRRAGADIAIAVGPAQHWKGLVMRVLTREPLLAVVSVATSEPSFAQTSLSGFGALPDRSLVDRSETRCSPRFRWRRVVRGRARRAGVRRVRKARQRHAEARRDRLGFTRIDVTASAFYGEGGVRLLAGSRSAVSPYVEGTAGVAHLRFGAAGPARRPPRSCARR